MNYVMKYSIKNEQDMHENTAILFVIYNNFTL
jgi:hypothetical protein